jgi:hypothetical protein
MQSHKTFAAPPLNICSTSPNAAQAKKNVVMQPKIKPRKHTHKDETQQMKKCSPKFIVMKLKIYSNAAQN